ncbi:MAG: AAA family ATPase [Actinomycetota bacterium]|nr:AAA family ATPase [Actinomycetota bacterium]
MAVLAMSADMLAEYAGLSKRAQKKVREIAGTVRELPYHELASMKGLHYERYHGARDARARTIRIDDNHRGIVVDAGDDQTLVLTRILTHDDADRWMANNEFRVNEATGALEIFDVVAIEGAVADVAASAPAEPTAAGLFAHRSDRDLTRLGIDPGVVPAVRAFTTEDELAGLLGLLPQGQAEALILLSGDESVEEIYAKVAGSIEPAEVDPTDVAGALTAPASGTRFRVIADERELEELLDAPLARWRTYLHHSQRSIAYRDAYNGPVRVTGGAGTGKTVVALHRTKALADALATEPSGDGPPILFTTFTRNLAQTIAADLELLGGPELLDRVEVTNVDQLAHRIVRDAEGAGVAIASGKEVAERCGDVLAELGLQDHLSVAFVLGEWDHVVLARECTTREDYFRASRAGRGVRLDRRGRADVWRVIEALRERLADRGWRTHLQVAVDATRHLRARDEPPYGHVVVDEGQDLHEAQWRMLRAAVAEGPNDLFIVGDSHQRIYDRRSSLSKVGVNIRGRSHTLRVNYRTTAEILRWGLGVLGREVFDDLDGGTVGRRIGDYHSFLHGAEPRACAASSRRAQLDELAKHVRSWVDAGIDASDIAVTARTKRPFRGVRRALTDAGLDVCVLGRELPIAPGVRVGTMHRLKGLEFRCVAIVDASDDVVPAPWDLTAADEDPVQHDLDLRRERCLLYVACTRARDHLWIGWSGSPSRFLARPDG